MIRFIYIDGQVCDEVKEFSFWDTITDTYFIFNKSQMWSSIKDFIADFKTEENNAYQLELERFTNKIPEEFNK